MAWFERSTSEGKNFQEGSPVAAVEVAPIELADRASGDLVACLYKGSRVTGQLSFHGPATIEGAVEGEVLCHGVLTIGEQAEVKAKISGHVVVIRGKVEGDVTARDKVEIEAPGRLLGNIVSPRLVVAEGVVFDGHCAMGRTEKKGEFARAPRAVAQEAAETRIGEATTDLEK
jgi:cytoskeletal protein CcmA (bactofilin family)